MLLLFGFKVHKVHFLFAGLIPAIHHIGRQIRT
jgi:hypothetical protein